MKSKSPIITKGAGGKPLVQRRLPTHRPKRSVTTDTALRLAKVTGMSADFWLGLQQDWDLWHALRSEKAREIAQLEPLKKAS